MWVVRVYYIDFGLSFEDEVFYDWCILICIKLLFVIFYEVEVFLYWFRGVVLVWVEKRIGWGKLYRKWNLGFIFWENWIINCRVD